MLRKEMKHKGKLIWEGFSWFVAAIVAALVIALVGGVLCAFFDARWPVYPTLILAVSALIGLPARAIVREIHRQKNLGAGVDAKKFRDDVIGTLNRSEDDPVMWETQFASDTGPVLIRIFGEGFPDDSLLLNARRLRESFSVFGHRITAFKASCVEADPALQRFADEICTLKVEMICFFEPTRPSEADIFYSGGFEGRCWHSGLIDGEPKGLSFDS